MLRFFGIAGLAALLAAPMMLSATPACAQIGTIFSDPPPRPPGNVPRGGSVYEDEEEVPDLPPQGRLLPTPNRPMPGQSAVPGPVQSQPLPPPPSAAVPPPQNPQQAAPIAPAAPPPAAGVAAAPPNAASPQPDSRQSKAAPPVPATLQPGDEVVTEPPAQKIINKKAVFSGLDKITGRIINFDVDIGETVQFGALRVKTDACYTRPSTESANTDAFVQVDEITLQGEVKRIFSGWMFATSPGLHGIEHPIYDIWLTDCKAPETTVVAGQAEAPKPAPPPAQKRAPKPRQQPQVYPPQGPQGPAAYPPPPPYR